MIGAGINLSAFGATRRPFVAIAQIKDGDIRVELKPASMFSRSKLSDRISDTLAGWRAGLLELPKPLFVDVALSTPQASAASSAMLWELTYRPLDFAFYADAPLTDKVGEFGVRFRAMLDDGFAIGTDILEASPRATVELMEFKGQYAGGAAHHGHSGWKADDRNKRGDKLMAKVLSELGVNPGPGAEKLSSDELDAMLCALTSLAYQRRDAVLTGKALDAEVTERCARRAIAEPNPAHTAPKACAVLFQPFWQTLTVSK